MLANSIYGLIYRLTLQGYRITNQLFCALPQLIQNLVLFQQILGKVPLDLQKDFILSINPTGLVQNHLSRMVPLGNKLHQLFPFLLQHLF